MTFRAADQKSQNQWAMKHRMRKKMTSSKSEAKNRKIVRALLKRYRKTFSEEAGVNPTRNTPANLFQLLTFSILSSARISGNIALEATKALKKKGWTDPRKMAKSTWSQRTRTLNRSGYARYDERTSRMLGDTSEYLLEKYRGDLRKLREESHKDPKEMRKHLKELKGIGDVGTDIFFREAQASWDELYPFLDKKAAKAAGKLGLPKSADRLASEVSKKDFPRLVSALVRCDLDNCYQEIKKEAA